LGKIYSIGKTEREIKWIFREDYDVQ
jgi:hypothetical protein